MSLINTGFQSQPLNVCAPRQSALANPLAQNSCNRPPVNNCAANSCSFGNAKTNNCSFGAGSSAAGVGGKSVQELLMTLMQLLSSSSPQASPLLQSRGGNGGAPGIQF